MPAPGSITVPVTGTVISSSAFGVPVANAINYVTQNSGTRPYFHGYLNGTQTLSAGVAAQVTLDSEIKDTDSMHTGTNNFITVNTAGLYHVIGQINFPSTASGQDHAILLHNGATAAGVDGPFIAASHRMSVTAYIQCVATDTIALDALSTSGGTLLTGSVVTFLQAFWVSL
jgi:hypothetical protein